MAAKEEINDKKICKFEPNSLCTNKCIHFKTCLRNPYRKAVKDYKTEE